MKSNRNIRRSNRGGSALLVALVLVCAMAIGGVFATGALTMNRAASAEETQTADDNNYDNGG